ncbi:MAG: hypothetical protein ACREA0_17310, partial [bacterium]
HRPSPENGVRHVRDDRPRIDVVSLPDLLQNAVMGQGLSDRVPLGRGILGLTGVLKEAGLRALPRFRRLRPCLALLPGPRALRAEDLAPLPDLVVRLLGASVTQWWGGTSW